MNNLPFNLYWRYNPILYMKLNKKDIKMENEENNLILIKESDDLIDKKYEEIDKNNSIIIYTKHKDNASNHLSLKHGVVSLCPNDNINIGSSVSTTSLGQNYAECFFYKPIKISVPSNIKMIFEKNLFIPYIKDISPYIETLNNSDEEYKYYIYSIERSSVLFDTRKMVSLNKTMILKKNTPLINIWFSPFYNFYNPEINQNIKTVLIESNELFNTT